MTLRPLYRRVRGNRFGVSAQAVRSFASFDPEHNQELSSIDEVCSQRLRYGDFVDHEPFDPSVLPNGYLTDPQPKHTIVYVCTIQRVAIHLFGRSAV